METSSCSHLIKSNNVNVKTDNSMIIGIIAEEIPTYVAAARELSLIIGDARFDVAS